MAAVILVQNEKKSIGSIFLGDGANGIPITKAYLGNILVFSGEKWLYCLMDINGVYLLDAEGFKIQPKMEVQ